MWTLWMASSEWLRILRRCTPRNGCKDIQIEEQMINKKDISSLLFALSILLWLVWIRFTNSADFQWNLELAFFKNWSIFTEFNRFHWEISSKNRIGWHFVFYSPLNFWMWITWCLMWHLLEPDKRSLTSSISYVFYSLISKGGLPTWHQR
jgi:hypothetical protein